MIVVLTGASSFIGRAASRRLTEEGHELICLRHSFEGEEERLPERADCWIHFAWAGVGSAGRSDPSIQDFNIDMSLRAFEKACKLSCKSFVFAGSQAEYGPSPEGLQREDTACFPVSEYGRAKLRFKEEAERYLLKRREQGESCPEYVHLRIFSVYGPGDHESSLISTAIRRLSEGSPLELGPCTQDWNYLYIEDAAKAIARICEKSTLREQGPLEIYNVAGRDTRPLRSYLEELSRICLGEDFDRGLLKFGQRGNNAEGAASLRPDITKLVRDTGWEPLTTFKEGAEKTLRYWRERTD